ncbi:MAG: 3-isopropylmalate dehydratase small subunit [Terriglobales bacterium]
MTPFTQVTGRAVALLRANVDTDQIIPKQFLKRTTRMGLGEGLFYDWRRDPEFVLNQPPSREATILLAGENFGCGSSREHAVWALADYGFRCVIAPSFADIFYNNCCKNGVLPVRLAAETIARCIQAVTLTVNLETQTVAGDGIQANFSLDAFRRQCLLAGLDEIGLTLRHEAAIERYEHEHRT